MGEAQSNLFEPAFNRSIKVTATDQRMTFHAGAILLRELDHQLGLMESLGKRIHDPRNPDKIRYTATELLRERVYAMTLGSENQDDLDRLGRGTFEDRLGGCWDLHRFQQSVLRAGGRVVKGARRLQLHIEQSVSRFWQVMTERLARLRLASLWQQPQGAVSRVLPVSLHESF